MTRSKVPYTGKQVGILYDNFSLSFKLEQKLCFTTFYFISVLQAL